MTSWTRSSPTCPPSRSRGPRQLARPRPHAVACSVSLNSTTHTPWQRCAPTRMPCSASTKRSSSMNGSIIRRCGIVSVARWTVAATWPSCSPAAPPHGRAPPAIPARDASHPSSCDRCRSPNAVSPRAESMSPSSWHAKRRSRDTTRSDCPTTPRKYAPPGCPDCAASVPPPWASSSTATSPASSTATFPRRGCWSGAPRP